MRKDPKKLKIKTIPSSNHRNTNISNELDRFKLYFDLVNDSIIIFEIDDKNIIQNVIDVNTVTIERLGYTREEIFERNNWRKIARTIFRDFEQNSEFFNENNSVVFDSIAYTKENSEIPIEISVRGSTIDDKKIIIVIARDVTERVELKNNLLIQKEELSEFAHTSAHNLRNPLIAINGYVKLIEKNQNLKYLEKISQLTEKMVKMIDKSLQLADSGSVLGVLETVDLNILMKNVLDTIVPKDVNIEVSELPKVKGNPTKIQIIFENLIENAITHGNASLIEIKNKTSSEFHRISITNDGGLFSSEARETAFKKRFTTKQNGYGGHGLLIVQKIIEAHNWKIDLKNDTKTTFLISIPRI
ncbi:MAG: Sensor protein ZraS [Candidatus Heimdallarchaeota archaeon LC_3]|nr:MAG: Sensor protein ZraS [Candidatus Heimdallarchaeota archaeon LC_3]